MKGIRHSPSKNYPILRGDKGLYSKKRTIATEVFEDLDRGKGGVKDE